MDTKEYNRVKAKQYWDENPTYKKYMNLKSKFYRNAQSILVRRHKEEFEKILNGLRNKEVKK